MQKIGFLGLVIDGRLKAKLVALAKKERRTQTTLIEEALELLFKARKVIKE